MTKTCRIKTLFGILNFGHCYLFVICDLIFGISNIPSLWYSPANSGIFDNTPEYGYENYFTTILTEVTHAGMEKDILCTLLS